MSKYEILLAAYALWQADLNGYMGGLQANDFPRRSPYICDCIEASGEFRRTTEGNYAELTKEVSKLIDGMPDVMDYLYYIRVTGVGQYVDWVPGGRVPLLRNYDPVVTAYRSGIWAGLLEKYKALEESNPHDLPNS